MIIKKWLKMKEKILNSRALPWALVVLSAAMIFYGTQNGEVRVVLEKAIRICMECIGIG